jgi:hypothetical protein
MADALSTSIELLRSASPRLNEATTQAGDVVRRVEDFLNDECKLGVTACVAVVQDDEAEWGTYLEYRRVGGKFRIAVVDSDFRGENETVKPWSDCSREEKLRSFQHLPQLITKVAEEVQRSIDAVSETGRTVTALMKALGPASPRPIAKRVVHPVETPEGEKRGGQ